MTTISLTTHPQFPVHALDAIVHPDPYPYYASLAARRPFEYDASLGLWVAAGSQAVAEVLRHPACGVRPAGAVVPAALSHGPAGAWFGALVRMNDGPAHAAMKPWLKARLAALSSDRDSLARLHEATQAACADAYLACGKTSAARLDDFVFRQPVYALAAWLGVPATQWTEVHADVRKLVAAMAEAARPSPREDVLDAGHTAATAMRSRAIRWLDADAAPGTWLQETARSAARNEGTDFSALTANIVGLFTQTHDACAGLVANSVRRVARGVSGTSGTSGTSGMSGTPLNGAVGASMRDSTGAPPADLRAAIQTVSDVIRFDPPVQNTRRFLHTPAVIRGRTLGKGDVILVLLASAGRAPDEVGDMNATDDTAWTFGLGAHACPGRTPASTIAAVGVHAILGGGEDLAPLGSGTAYHPLPNARIARFSA
ncbi:cytochrome p450 oxidoreductase [Pandoraea captiosa]|uniref:Cytochrome p450 oxidoreductase n=1 Tax=Pandoraea captiosa TaxID=2508302 RepID=A0A5E5A6V2_9BURK|nr:cytochrome P450 [Pandoraea captiosa]VVE69401.1 cytochrome p450 oxidoreductase [Pandoraea captiosa]